MSIDFYNIIKSLSCIYGGSPEFLCAVPVCSQQTADLRHYVVICIVSLLIQHYSVALDGEVLLCVLPGQHKVGAGTIGPRACGAPLDGVDFFTVGLEVMDTQVLLHTPYLCQRRNKLLVRLLSQCLSAHSMRMLSD